jgi:hypothetical protein
MAVQAAGPMVKDVQRHLQKLPAHLARMALFDLQVVEIREALEKITDEKHANNVSLASIIREAKVPTKVPTESKTARSGARFRPFMLQQEFGAPGRI